VKTKRVTKNGQSRDSVNLATLGSQDEDKQTRKHYTENLNDEQLAPHLEMPELEFENIK
jgi:hypothetical protein